MQVRWYDALFILTTLLLTALIFRGLFYPDPYILEKGAGIRVILWGLRVLLPVAGLACCVLYLALRNNKISPFAPLLIALSISLTLLIAYPFANLFYERSFSEQLDKYHPYLQIRPQSFEARDAKQNVPMVKIMCLGGSTTEFHDHAGNGWPGRLEERLQRALPGLDVQVYNMGRQWYTTQHTLINYELNLRQYHPDFIIVMQSVNDLLTNADFSYLSSGSFRTDYGHFYGPVNRIIRHPSLLSFVSEIISGLWYAKPREEVVTNSFPGLASYERNLKTLLELAARDGTKVIFMTEPSLFKDSMSNEERLALHLINYESIGPHKRWSIATAKAGMEQYNARMSSIAAANNVLLIDLDKAVPKTLQYFYDEVHYRTPTYNLIASVVAQALLQSHVFANLKEQANANTKLELASKISSGLQLRM